MDNIDNSTKRSEVQILVFFLPLKILYIKNDKRRKYKKISRDFILFFSKIPNYISTFHVLINNIGFLKLSSMMRSELLLLAMKNVWVLLTFIQTTGFISSMKSPADNYIQKNLHYWSHQTSNLRKYKLFFFQSWRPVSFNRNPERLLNSWRLFWATCLRISSLHRNPDKPKVTDFENCEELCQYSNSVFGKTTGCIFSVWITFDKFYFTKNSS